MSGQYPNSFYRATVKAFIRNANGDILVVQEKGDKWSLPGGGIDHGESPIEALARELKEELNVTDKFHVRFVGIDSYFYTPKDSWLMWIMYEVTFDADIEFSTTDDVDAVAFKNLDAFKNPQFPYQRLIYKWATK